eukprot:14927791-Alexandrium_andersonii.AAC.1
MLAAQHREQPVQHRLLILVAEQFECGLFQNFGTVDPSGWLPSATSSPSGTGAWKRSTTSRRTCAST